MRVPWQRPRIFVLRSIAAAFARSVPAWCIEKTALSGRTMGRTETPRNLRKAHAMIGLLMFDFRKGGTLLGTEATSMVLRGW
jgi:hypothetical protein